MMHCDNKQTELSNHPGWISISLSKVTLILKTIEKEKLLNKMGPVDRNVEFVHPNELPKTSAREVSGSLKK